MDRIYKCAILGASGYTGAELIRLLAGHDGFSLSALSAARKAGQKIADIYPHMRHLDLPLLQPIEDIDFTDLDFVFCALPHGFSQQIVRQLPASVKVVDLSADFRLESPAAYQQWYKKPHEAPELQPQAVYGLTEFYRASISAARLVAGTGCNAAAGQYALRPVIAEKLVSLDDIIIDLKTGVSGAGRVLSEHLLHSELSEGLLPYGAGGVHRHLAEFDQEFSKIAGCDVRVVFQPHLVPMNRGILASVHVRARAQDLYECLHARYREEPFIELLPFGQVPSTHNLRGSNFAHLSVVGDRIAGRAIIFCALDNLMKGASGQALQNANLMAGFAETTGLMQVPIFP